MKRILISYDLKHQSDYSALEKDLLKLGGVRILESVWCLAPLNSSADSLLNRLRAHIHSDDSIIVAEFSVWAEQNLKASPEDAVMPSNSM